MKLDDLLHDASVALDRVTDLAPERRLPDPASRSRGTPAVLVIAALLVLGGVVALIRDGESETIVSDAAVPVGPNRLATTSAPDDLALRFLGSAADLGLPGRVTTNQVYVDPNDPSNRLVLGYAPDGAFRIPLAGETVDLSVGSGRSLPGETLLIVDLDEGQLVIDSSTRSTADLVEIVEELEFRDDGSPAEIVGISNLTLIGSVEQAFYQHLPVTVDPEAQVASYVARPDRHLTVTVVANESDNWPAHLHIDSYQVEQFGDTSASVVRHDNFVQLIWLDGQSLVTISAVGLSDEEVDLAVAGLQETTKTSSLAEVDPSTGESAASLPQLGDVGLLHSDYVPEGFELAAPDHRLLGDGQLATTDVLLFDETAARTIRFEVNENGTDHTPLDGVTVEVDGIEVTYTVGLTQNIAQFHHGDQSVKVTAGLTSELLLALVDDVLDTDLSPAALADAAATPLFSTQETMTWLTEDGRAVSGPPEAASATYINDATEASITISSRPSDRPYPTSVLHTQSASIDLGTTDGVLSPNGEGWKIDFVTKQTLVTVAGSDASTQELLDVIEALRPAD